LKSYCRDFENASILFPLGAFNCISNLLEISSNKLVLISSDKGFTDRNYVKGRREQPFVAHHGIFSYSVNYDAIRRYFEALGGVSLNTTDDNLSVSSAVNYLLDGTECALENSRFYFEDKMDRQNLSNYLYFMQDLLTDLEPKKSNEILRACMGYIQLCNFDPIVFCLAAPRIYMALETITASQAEHLLHLLDKVRENFYSVQQQYDVFYWVGRIYYGMSRLDDALKAFADSLLTFGESSSALYYTAACYEVKKDFKTALRYYKDTLRLEPDCEFTRGGVNRVEAYISGKETP
jgi:tetratricopeptide (TPR) repeat protein